MVTDLADLHKVEKMRLINSGLKKVTLKTIFLVSSKFCGKMTLCSQILD